MIINAILFYILSSAITSRRDNTIFYNRFLLIVFFNTILISLLSLNFSFKGIGLYSNLFNINSINIVFNIFILILSMIILNLNSFYPRKVSNKNFNFNELISKILNKSGEQYKIIEYPLIILFVITGAIFLMNSNDIISVFLSIELQSYGLYLLCTLFRNNELSTSAGLTYFLLGSLSSCFILLGTTLLYTNSGVTNLDNYYIINNLYEIKSNMENIMNNYTNYSLLVMSIGFLFKISAAPFHFWSPDVYDAVPTITTIFVAIVTKISIFIFIFELINYTNNPFILNISWTISLLFSSLLSLIIGTVLGLNQSRIKRLLAYSTISHLGFILLSLSINSIESMQAFIFYIMQYSISNLNTFIILISIGYSLYIYVNKDKENDKLLDRNNSPIQLINQLKGFFIINPLLSTSLAITIYSLIGIPPLIGFFGKQIVLSSSLDQGYVYITLIAILTSVISAVYYLNIIKHIFFEKPEFEKNINIEKISINNILKNKEYNNVCLSGNLTLPISILTLIILLFILNPEEWLNLSNVLSTTVFI